MPPRGLVRPVPLDPSGEAGPTRGQAQGPRWRQTTKGFYVPSNVDDEVSEQRILEQSVRLPPGGAVNGWAGLRLARAAYFDGLRPGGRESRPVPLVVPPSSKLRGLPGSSVCREPLDPREVRVVLGVPATVTVRALFDELRSLDDWREAVVAMDMAAAAVLVSVAEMRSYLGTKRSWRRSSGLAKVLDLADEESLSPGETRMRLVWVVDAGLPRPLSNRPIFTLEGRLLGYADLFDPSAGVVGEYDGGTHLRLDRQTSDVDREDQFRRAGLEYFKVTGLDMHHRGRVVDRMKAARSRAIERPGQERRWTLLPPPWWRGRETAADLLNHRDWLRAQHDSA